MTCPLNSQSSTCQSSEGVNEETARIGRLLLDSIPIPFIENISNLYVWIVFISLYISFFIVHKLHHLLDQYQEILDLLYQIEMIINEEFLKNMMKVNEIQMNINSSSGCIFSLSR
jgi:hypothetical protein